MTIRSCHSSSETIVRYGRVISLLTRSRQLCAHDMRLRRLHGFLSINDKQQKGLQSIVGHDRGARVGLIPARIISSDRPLVVMDTVPNQNCCGAHSAGCRTPTGSSSSIVVSDLPETLIAGRTVVGLRHFFSDWCDTPHLISASFDTYVGLIVPPGAVRGAMSDSRANVAEDNAARSGSRNDDFRARCCPLGCRF